MVLVVVQGNGLLVGQTCGVTVAFTAWRWRLLPLLRLDQVSLRERA